MYVGLGRDEPNRHIEDRLGVVLDPRPCISQVAPLDLEDGVIGLLANVEETAIFKHDVYQACDDAGSVGVAGEWRGAVIAIGE